MIVLHDLINLMQVLLPFLTGLFAWFLSNKKSDRDYLKDENKRLNDHVIRLTKRVDELENEKEERENKNDGK